MSKPRKHYSPEEKVLILRRNLVEKVPVSDLWEMRDVDQNLQISIDPSGPLHNRKREKRRMKTLKDVPQAH